MSRFVDSFLSFLDDAFHAPRRADNHRPVGRPCGSYYGRSAR
jgi:hypothetical protein